jgi:hypothetical protein
VIWFQLAGIGDASLRSRLWRRLPGRSAIAITLCPEERPPRVADFDARETRARSRDIEIVAAAASIDDRTVGRIEYRGRASDGVGDVRPVTVTNS